MDIEITKDGYKPGNIILEPPARVIWHNNDDKPHTVTADDGHSFDSGNIPPGKTFEFNFRQKGIYAYHDKNDPNLQGELSISSIPTPE